MGEVKVILVLLCLIAGTTVLHLLALKTIARRMPRMRARPGLSSLGMILWLLLAHLAEIVLFAIGYAWVVQWASMGALEGDLSGAWTDYVYFSASVYTTMGFGDIIPTGPVRLMAGFECLTGLMMIAWSGSFTFLQMQRLWEE